MDIGILCSHCKQTFEMPRWVIIQMYKAIMSYSPLPKEELDLFKQLKDLKVIFDVGARDDTEYLELWPESEHHLFEPNPEFFEKLQEKVKGNVFANNFGLGEKEENKGYYSPLQGFLGSGNVPDNVTPDLVLPIQTLVKYVTDKGIETIDFLKIDTEGHDRKVILGAKGMWDKIRFIQYEHWGDPDNFNIRDLLASKFEMYNVGYRNVLCMNFKLVSERERNELRTYILDNKLKDLA